MSTGGNIAAMARDAQPVYIVVSIKYHVPTGQVVQLDGPLESGALMYGILELAREAFDLHRARTIKRQTAQLAQGPGILAPGG